VIARQAVDDGVSGHGGWRRAASLRG
jgi:hypothetical protein